MALPIFSVGLSHIDNLEFSIRRTVKSYRSIEMSVSNALLAGFKIKKTVRRNGYDMHDLHRFDERTGVSVRIFQNNITVSLAKRIFRKWDKSPMTYLYDTLEGLQLDGVLNITNAKDIRRGIRDIVTRRAKVSIEHAITAERKSGIAYVPKVSRLWKLYLRPMNLVRYEVKGKYRVKEMRHLLRQRCQSQMVSALPPIYLERHISNILNNLTSFGVLRQWGVKLGIDRERARKLLRAPIQSIMLWNAFDRVLAPRDQRRVCGWEHQNIV